jgi:hypothetical protein
MENISTFLTGTWFICFSNFTMWTKGDKVQPAFHYEIAANRKGNSILTDEVRYFKKGKEKSIKGFDTPSPSDPNAFLWRGKGFLKLLSSHWKVVLKDEDKGEWAVIHFSKTLFTPAGIDVISRQSAISPETWRHIILKMSIDKSLVRFIPQLKPLN